MQKGLLWLFGAMFLVPEILFLNLISFPLYFMGIKFSAPVLLLIGSDYSFTPFYFLSILGIEILGLFGMSFISFKLNKKILSLFLGIIIFLLCVIFYFVYGASRMSF